MSLPALVLTHTLPAQLRKMSEEHKWLASASPRELAGGAAGREARQERLDEEERSTRMRLAADKADLQRQRAAARAELLRRQLDLQEQCSSFLSSRRYVACSLCLSCACVCL